MPATTANNELLDQERRFWNAMRDKDAAAAGAMTDEGCIVAGAQGVAAIDPAMMSKMTREGKWTLERYDFDLKTSQVRFISDDIAIVAYQVTEDVIVDGKKLQVKANDASVWVRRDGDWRCALHTESLAGDPYGRDRMKS